MCPHENNHQYNIIYNIIFFMAALTMPINRWLEKRIVKHEERLAKREGKKFAKNGIASETW